MRRENSMAKNNLQKTLTEEGLSQAQLAREANLSIGTVNRIAKGRKDGAPRTNHAILKALSRLVDKDLDYEDIFPFSRKY